MGFPHLLFVFIAMRFTAVFKLKIERLCKANVLSAGHLASGFVESTHARKHRIMTLAPSYTCKTLAPCDYLTFWLAKCSIQTVFYKLSIQTMYTFSGHFKLWSCIFSSSPFHESLKMHVIEQFWTSLRLLSQRSLAFKAWKLTYAYKIIGL